MPPLTRHQKPTLKLSLPWKIFLAVAVLLLLLAFKDLFYRLDQQEDVKEQQSSDILKGTEMSSSAALQSPAANSIVQAPSSPVLPSLTPTPSPALGKLKITSTPTGYLNVRATPSSDGKIITQVSPGSIFGYTAQQAGWYQITLPSGQTGWVSSQCITTNLTTPPSAPAIKHRDDVGADDN
jgi:uncharacterized protein YgiM (DUF1202 family)